MFEVRLRIFQHLFTLCLGADQATSHHQSQWWLDYWRTYSSRLGVNELKFMAAWSNKYPFSRLRHLLRSCYKTSYQIVKSTAPSPLLKFNLFPIRSLGSLLIFVWYVPWASSFDVILQSRPDINWMLLVLILFIVDVKTLKLPCNLNVPRLAIVTPSRLSISKRKGNFQPNYRVFETCDKMSFCLD